MNKFEYQKRLRGAGLTAPQYMVLMTLQTYANADGTRAHPGWERLRADTGLDPRTIKSAVGALCKRGFLREVESKKVRGSANVYDLTLPDEGTTVAQQENPRSAEPNPRGTSDAPRGTSDAVQGGHPVPPHQILTPDPDNHERHAVGLRRTDGDEDNWTHGLEPLAASWKPWPRQMELAASLGLSADDVLNDFISMHHCSCSRAPRSKSWGAKFEKFIKAYPDERHLDEFEDHRERHDTGYDCPHCETGLIWADASSRYDFTCPECSSDYYQPQGATS